MENLPEKLLVLDLDETLVHSSPTRLGRDPGETLAAVEAHALENLPLREAPAANARFAPLPAGAVTDKTWKALDKAIKAQAYRDLGLTLYECKALKLWSQAGEDGASFAARVQHGLREQRDLDMAKLRAQFQPKLAKLQERIQKAEQKVRNEQGQVRQRQMDTAVNVGTTVLGAILGSRSVARGASAVRSASRIGQDQQQVQAAEENVKFLEPSFRERDILLDVFLRAQVRRAEAQQAYYLSLVDYNKAITNLYYRKGTILAYNNIRISEGAWTTDAYKDASRLHGQRAYGHDVDVGTEPSEFVSPVPLGRVDSTTYQPEQNGPEPTPSGQQEDAARLPDRRVRRRRSACPAPGGAAGHRGCRWPAGRHCPAPR